MNEHMKAILAALQTDGLIRTTETFWSWVRDGEFGSPALNMTSEEAGKAITALVKEGFLEIRVRKDELMLQLAGCTHCGTIKPLKRCFLCSRLLCNECARADQLTHLPKDDPEYSFVEYLNRVTD